MSANPLVKLTSPRVWRTYRGGSLIDAIHGTIGSEDTQLPEEWIMSIVNARNVGREHIPDEGLCYLSGREITLRDYIRSDPAALLGEAHYQKYGPSTGVLVKIIDAAERLTIQAHPTREKAAELFHSPFGKTECWHILGTRAIDYQEPCIYLGFREGITREYWQQLFEQQDIPAMLSCLHKFNVQPGETYLVHAGVPHAIGAGCLLIEIQEPTDFTVRTERVTPKGLKVTDFLCHQGLGFEKMFDCFDYEGVSLPEARKKWCFSPVLTEQDGDFCRRKLIGAEQTPCFSLEQYTINGTAQMASGEIMSGLYIYSGSGRIHCGGSQLDCRAGDQFFYPASGEELRIQADEGNSLTIFRCFGPAV